MSRGRPRHQASRRRSYSVRQREVRERRLRLPHDEPEWLLENLGADGRETAVEIEQPTFMLRLDGRATAA
jgi:hypothetical protein